MVSRLKTRTQSTKPLYAELWSTLDSDSYAMGKTTPSIADLSQNLMDTLFTFNEVLVGYCHSVSSANRQG